jgi:hypothetical protein
VATRAKAFVSPVNLTLSIQQSNKTDNSYLDAAMAIAVVTICAAKGAWRDPVGKVAAALPAVRTRKHDLFVEDREAIIVGCEIEADCCVVENRVRG